METQDGSGPMHAAGRQDPLAALHSRNPAAHVGSTPTHPEMTHHQPIPGHPQAPFGSSAPAQDGPSLAFSPNHPSLTADTRRKTSTLGKRARDDWYADDAMYDDGMEEVAEHEAYVKRPFDIQRAEVTPGMTNRIAALAVASPSQGSVPSTPLPGLDLGGTGSPVPLEQPYSDLQEAAEAPHGDAEDTEGNHEYREINALLRDLAIERATRAAAR